MKKDYEKMWVAMGKMLQTNTWALKSMAPIEVPSSALLLGLIIAYQAIEENQHLEEKVLMTTIGDTMEKELKELGVM